MAVYFDHKIQAPSVGVQTDITWHSNYSLLAVASKNDGGVGGAVNFYLDEGELVEESSIQRSCEVTSFCWHPTRKILAVGWESGDILVWNEHDHDLHEVSSVHTSPVRIIEWSLNGNRLVSGDENGDVVVWKADQRGRLNQTPAFQHNVQSAIKTCVFKTSDSFNDEPSWRKSKLTALSQASENSSFFVGTANGTVHYIDDKGRCTQSFTTEGPVKTLLYTEGKDILVAVTEGLMLSQHTVTKDGSTNEIMKVKLSGQGVKSQMIWAGKQILATASGEAVVRMWDLDQDDNYVLSLDGGGFEAGECINKISYNKSKGILAGCTNKGKVAMWKDVMSKNKTDSQSRWEAQPASVLEGEGELTQIQFAGDKNLLAVNCVATVIILNEQVMNAHYNLQVAAVQVSPSQLTVENFSSSFNQDLKTDIHIKGVFVTKNHTTIWNGKRIVVYEVSTDKAMVRAEGHWTLRVHTAT